MRIKLAMAALLLAACGTTSGPLGPPVNGSTDMANGAPGSDLSNPITPTDGGTPTAGCAGNYAKSNVAAMRSAGTKGCFELDGIVTLANSSPTSTKSYTIYAQDAGGGDFSGIRIYCTSKISSTTNMPECPVLSTAEGILAGRTITVTGYYEKFSDSSEQFALDSITDTGSGTAPRPAQVTLADIERGAGATNPKNWYQKVQLDIASADTLKMYDFSVKEFAYSSTSCMYHESGFGMIPSSVTPTTPAGPSCSSTTTPPAGVATPDVHEVLIGTDFYTNFTAQSECACVSASTMKPYKGLCSSSTTLSGNVTGLLIYDYGVLYLAPLVNTTTENNFTNLGT